MSPLLVDRVINESDTALMKALRDRAFQRNRNSCHSLSIASLSKESELILPLTVSLKFRPAMHRQMEINPSTFISLKPGVCSGLILSDTLHSVLKDGVWRRRNIDRK